MAKKAKHENSVVRGATETSSQVRLSKIGFKGAVEKVRVWRTKQITKVPTRCNPDLRQVLRHGFFGFALWQNFAT